MSFTLSGSRVLFRRTLVAADMMYRGLRRMQLLKLVRMLLLKEVMLGSKRRRLRLRLCCGGKVEASCCNPAALLRHPKGGHVPPQLPPPPPLMLHRPLRGVTTTLSFFHCWFACHLPAMCPLYRVHR